MSNLHRNSRCLNFWYCVAVITLTLHAVSSPAQEAPLYEQVPFDSLTLKPEFGGGTFKLLPIGFRNGIAPSPLPRAGTLVITFADEPDDKYEVEWQAVASIVTYQEAVFSELQQHLRRGNFDAAHGYFDYLFRNAPAFPGLQAAYELMLITEAKQFLKNGDSQNAVARFERLYEENREHAELKQLWSAQVNGKLAEWMQHENCDRMRKLISHFEERYPENEVGRTWLAAIDRRAKNYIDQAGRAHVANRYIEAYDCLENARRVLGDPEALKDVERSLRAICPKIVVAVSQMPNVSASFFPVENRPGSADTSPAPLTDATIRSRRLLQHTMVEYAGSGIDGGIYASPIGMFSISQTGFEWALHDDLQWADGTAMTAYDLAETLERLFFRQQDSAKNNNDYMIERLVQSIDVLDNRTVTVQLNGETMFPASRLRVPMSRAQSLAFVGSGNETPGDQGNENEQPDESRNWNGPYFLEQFVPPSPERDEHFSRASYSRNMRDPFSTSDKPGVLVEQTLAPESDALQLLLEGKIDLLEHVPPDKVQAWRVNDQIVIGKYAAPHVHFLLPNRNKPVTSNRTFLRGMLYGLDRTWMLQELLGENRSEGTVLSAPMPKRTKPDDPFGYAYNDRVSPRPYEPKLAVALSVTAYNQVKNRELLKAQQRQDDHGPANDQTADGQNVAEKDATESPESTDITAEKRDLHGYLASVPEELVLACPPNDTARKACLMIQQQWRTVGIPVRVVEYRPEERIGRGTDVDFWYVEMTMLEPCIDLELLFGNNGMVTDRSTYLELAMSRVRMARDWREAIESLENLHRTLYDETTVLPLWQINSHFAHRRELTGVPAETFRLYDQIEQWRMDD